MCQVSAELLEKIFCESVSIILSAVRHLIISEIDSQDKQAFLRRQLSLVIVKEFHMPVEGLLDTGDLLPCRKRSLPTVIFP